MAAEQHHNLMQWEYSYIDKIKKFIGRAKDFKQYKKSKNDKVQEEIDIRAMFNHQVAI